MQRPKLDAANGMIEAADFAFGLDKLPTGAVEVPADESEMLLELVKVLLQSQQ